MLFLLENYCSSTREVCLDSFFISNFSHYVIFLVSFKLLIRLIMVILEFLLSNYTIMSFLDLFLLNGFPPHYGAHFSDSSQLWYILFDVEYFYFDCVFLTV